MRSFLSFLQIPIEEEHKIYTFDFDDTLVKKTRSKVFVRDKRTGHRRELNSGEFAQFRPEDHHELDFSGFHAVLDPQPLDPADRIARRVSRKKRKREVVILTARPKEAEPHIRKYLKTRGVRGKNLTIIAVGSSDPNAKRVALKDHITKRGKKVTHVEFMDDHQANVEAVGSLQKEMPHIKFRLRVVKPHK